MKENRLSLDIEWLEDFLEVVRQGTFTQAAAFRGVTQPSLSRRIRNLERWLGATLFNRDLTEVEKLAALPAGYRRGTLSLTSSGLELQKTAGQIVELIRQTRDQVKQVAPANSMPIYTVHSLASTFVPEAIKVIRRQLPKDEFGLNTTIVVGTISDCVEAISYAVTPFMICYENPKQRILFPADVPAERIKSIRIAQDRLIPVCKYSEAEKYQSLIKNKKPVPYLAYSAGTYLSHLVREKIEELDISNLDQIDDAPMADTLRNLARAGQGMAWVLESTAKNGLQAREIRRIFTQNSADEAIPLNIMLFRATDYVTKNDELIAIERTWKRAGQLEELLAKEFKVVEAS